MIDRKLSYTHNRIQHVYLILSLIFGLTFVFINGPFQSPDEYNHFYRAYQISEGHLISEKYNNENGAYVPRSLIESSEIEYSTTIKHNPQNKFKIQSIISSLNTKLKPKEEMFVALPNTSLYAPILYIPQSTGILIGRILKLSPLILMYLGRIFNLIFSTNMIYFAMKNIPNKKYLLFILGLMPMLLYQSASLSADGVTNCVAIFTISYFIRLMGEYNKKLTIKQIIKLVILVITISLAKEIYFMFSLLFFMIPKEKFKSNREYYLLGIGLFLLSVLVSIFWMKVSSTSNVLSTNRNASPKNQVLYITNHPILFIKTFFNTLNVYGNYYYKTFIGMLGWLDTKLPEKIIYSYIIMIIISSM